MPRRPITKDACECIARDINRLIHPVPALTAANVSEYYAPTMLDRGEFLDAYDDDTYLLVERALNRELRYLHAR